MSSHYSVIMLCNTVRRYETLRIITLITTRRQTLTTTSSSYAAPTRTSGGFGGTKLGKGGPTLEKVKLPVETEAARIVKFVCGSDISKENPQDIEIKDDSEYPDWLWTVRLGRLPPLHEMDSDSKEFWRRTQSRIRRYRNDLKKLKKF